MGTIVRPIPSKNCFKPAEAMKTTSEPSCRKK